MKIRTDFVSNSSSCSFVIQDINTFTSKLNAFQGVIVPYEFSDVVQIYIGTTNRNVRKLNQIMDKLKLTRYNDEHFKSEYFKETLQKYPDAESWDTFSVTFDQLVDFVTSDEFENAKDLITYIRFESEDYGSGPGYLAQVYNFCVLNDCKPDASDSEHSFLTMNENRFFELLSKVV